MPDTTCERKTYKVPAENLEWLRGRVEVLNRKVARLAKRGYKVEPVQIVVGELKSETKKTSAGVVVETVYADVELLSPRPPKVDGWQFVAVLSHVDEVGAMLRVCPGADLAEGELRRYRDADSRHCDHCQLRRSRTDTFVVRNASGELKQVGRQCLAAYTGLANPLELCEAAELSCAVGDLMREAEDSDHLAGPKSYASIEYYLPYVACSIREDGWLSRTSARERGTPGASTADQALSRGLFSDSHTRNRYVPVEKDFNLAAATISHCAERFEDSDVDSLSDYENSLRVAMASGIMRPKFEGIIASAILFYQKDVERRARAENWAKRAAKSRYQGTVGERGIFEDLRVEICRVLEGDFGPQHLYAFADPTDNMFAYFSTHDLDLSPGQVVSLQGRVKKHEMRTTKDGTSYQQTLLTRCNLVTRAKVTSHELVKQYMGKLNVTNPEEVKKGAYATYEHVLEPVHVYHLETADGRHYAISSKAKKKGLDVGVIALVGYDTGNTMIDGARAAGLVSVLALPTSF